MLDKFLPPTDNLYKFQAIAGLMLMFAALVPWYLAFDFYERLLLQEKESEVFFIKTEHDSVIFQEYSQLSDVFTKEIDNLIARGNATESQSEKSEMIEKDLARLTEIKKMLDEKWGNIRKHSLELDTKEAEWKTESKLMRFYLAAIGISGVVGIALLYVGSLMMRKGFHSWKVNVQEPMDKILLNQANQVPQTEPQVSPVESEPPPPTRRTGKKKDSIT